jgi:two-component system sensor histidine kinase UhpB
MTSAAWLERTFRARRRAVSPSILAPMPLFWRVFLINALVMGAGALLLVLTPATISSPVSASQVAVLGAGLVLLLALDFLLIRPYIRPLEDLTGAMTEVDLLRPGTRMAETSRTPELRAVSEAFNGMLVRLEEERRLSARRALAAQEGERLRVSRELHDEVGQRLTGVLLRLGSVETRAPTELRGDIERVRDEVRLSLEEVRETARRLRPEALEDLGLASALAALTHDISRGTPLSINRTVAGELDDLGDELDVVVYRVAQEALTNVIRHSGARHAVLSLTRQADELLLTVTDDGCGFQVTRSMDGAGLTGMRERALLVGGALRVKSRPGGGTSVRLSVPVGRQR